MEVYGCLCGSVEISQPRRIIVVKRGEGGRAVPAALTVVTSTPSPAREERSKTEQERRREREKVLQILKGDRGEDTFAGVPMLFGDIPIRDGPAPFPCLKVFFLHLLRISVSPPYTSGLPRRTSLWLKLSLPDYSAVF